MTSKAVGQHLLVTFNTASWPAFPAGTSFALSADTDDASAVAASKWLAASSCGVTAIGSARALAGSSGAPEAVSIIGHVFNNAWLATGLCHTIAVRGYQAPATVAAPSPAPRTGNGTLLDPDFGTAVIFEAHAWRAQRAAIVTPALNFSRPARAWIAAQLWSVNRVSLVPMAPLTPTVTIALAVDAGGVGVALLPDIPLGGGGGGGPWLAPGQAYAVAIWAGCAADVNGTVTPGAASCVRLAHMRGAMPLASRPAGAVGADAWVVRGASRQLAAAGNSYAWGALNVATVGDVAVWDADGVAGGPMALDTSRGTLLSAAPVAACSGAGWPLSSRSVAVTFSGRPPALAAGGDAAAVGDASRSLREWHAAAVTVALRAAYVDTFLVTATLHAASLAGVPSATPLSGASPLRAYFRPSAPGATELFTFATGGSAWPPIPVSTGMGTYAIVLSSNATTGLEWAVCPSPLLAAGPSSPGQALSLSPDSPMQAPSVPAGAGPALFAAGPRARLAISIPSNRIVVTPSKPRITRYRHGAPPP